MRMCLLEITSVGRSRREGKRNKRLPFSVEVPQEFFAPLLGSIFLQPRLTWLLTDSGVYESRCGNGAGG